MKLNTPIKILAFCILSFQSSWYFVFCIPWETKHSLHSQAVIIGSGCVMFSAASVVSKPPVPFHGRVASKPPIPRTMHAGSTLF
jgi:hypothetical protein